MKCMSSLLAARLMQLDLAIDSKDRIWNSKVRVHFGTLDVAVIPDSVTIQDIGEHYGGIDARAI
jgi:hypothetical protein